MTIVKGLIVFAFTAVYVRSDVEHSEGDITSAVKGYSGKIAVLRSGINKSEGVTIAFDAMSEYHINGTEI